MLSKLVVDQEVMVLTQKPDCLTPRNQHNFNIGDICKVLSDNGGTLCIERLSDGMSQTVSRKDLLAVGDRVKGGKDWGSGSSDREKVVKSLVRQEVKVDYPDGSFPPNTYPMSPTCQKLAHADPESKPEASHPFKVGDRVKWWSSTQSRDIVGKIFKIVGAAHG